MLLADSGTHFGFILSGTAKLVTALGEFPTPAGCYFSLAEAGRLYGSGAGLIVTRQSYKGTFLLGGPIEERGRLRYINGCSDSILIPPLRVGDPCLNMLYVPPNLDQTAHTHPSIRIGIVVSGKGRCVVPEGEEAMTPGDIFVLPADMVHSFHTSSDYLRIVVYHPDSDCGPSDDAHPMVTRTLVDGRPASDIPAIRTTTLDSGG